MQKQLEFVEMDQLVDQLDAETTQELLANKDVQDLLHLNL
jgi:hypothetical protein